MADPTPGFLGRILGRRGLGTARRVAAADSVVVIGLGRFGTALALELMAQGTEVLGIDDDPAIVQSLNGHLTQVVRADATSEAALRQLSVPDFDRAVVAIGIDVEASLLATSLLLRFGIEHVWAKALTTPHGEILAQLGVPHVVYPEAEMGRRLAHLVRGSMKDYVQVDSDFALVTTTAPAEAVGRPLGECRIRARHDVTVVAVKPRGGGFTYTTAETVLQPGDTIIVAGSVEAAERFSQLR
ncbi:trk system potassium uptake protein TrkA [Kineococcus xinjiangensis]|uniref:Trk system potassium uptake protein TrkA n=1 Tax=Kineococcus xinjiangensis TaxID=512762 RepID=A0A2S6IC25_9ACTN|nr:TrkA family potassium uptake protein [Kineococcus xinjiangensis]PPK90801.1 trk system potassium uptake protein TrkA [Kineococcus xinjiangensis]